MTLTRTRNRPIRAMSWRSALNRERRSISLAAVPKRRREIKAFHVTGYTYEEIANRLGLRYARVNALMVEDNAAIRREHTRVAPELQPRSDRATRLRDLEDRFESPRSPLTTARSTSRSTRPVRLRAMGESD
jgi:hypothetical protein